MHDYRDIKPMSFLIFLFFKTGFYQFCCEGVYCPYCPLELKISIFGQDVTLNSAINLSCVNTSFTATFNSVIQPVISTVKVSKTVNLSLRIVINYLEMIMKISSLLIWNNLGVVYEGTLLNTRNRV